MRLLKAYPVRRQVIGAVLVLLVPLTAALIWSGRVTISEREAELRDQTKAVAATSAAYLNQYLDGLDSLASALTRHPCARAASRGECDAIFTDVLRDQPLLLNIVLTTTDGALRGSALPARYDGEPVRLPYLSQVVQSGRRVVSDLTTGQVSRKPTIILAYPVGANAGDVVGVLAFGVNLERMQTLFAGIPLPDGSVVTLADRTSRVLARSREAQRFIGTTLNARPLEPKDAPATSIETGVDGIPRIFGNSVIERGPWLLSVGIPRSVANARLRASWWRNLAISAFGILGTLIMALWLTKHLSEQLDRLRAAAQRIAGGDLRAPARTRVANLELAELQDAFITMANSLRETRDALDRQVEQERKMREMLQSLQRQVVRQERLAAVGLLVSGVAHELNNPLQAILGTIELLERHGTLTAEILDEVAFIKTQSGRAREIIRNLSRFSSQQSGPPALVDLRDVIAEVVQLRRRNLESASITLETESTSSRPVYANFTELEQVILNFVINAQQSIEAAGHARGRILIRLSDAGKWVRLEVLDDGPGVRPEDEPKLFQPFFTTKPVGKGTGLGLSVSYGIIESYGGSIGYRRNDWQGATFFFELPAASHDETSQTEHDRPPVLQRPLSPGV